MILRSRAAPQVAPGRGRAVADPVRPAQDRPRRPPGVGRRRRDRPDRARVPPAPCLPVAARRSRPAMRCSTTCGDRGRRHGPPWIPTSTAARSWRRRGLHRDPARRGLPSDSPTRRPRSSASAPAPGLAVWSRSSPARATAVMRPRSRPRWSRWRGRVRAVAIGGRWSRAARPSAGWSNRCATCARPEPADRATAPTPAARARRVDQLPRRGRRPQPPRAGRGACCSPRSPTADGA